MILASVLVLNYLSIATAYHIPRQLISRQEVCDASSAPVQSCGTADLTTANWEAFNIDGFLSNFITAFGNGVASGLTFPQFFVNQNIPPGSTFNFDCGNDLSSCRHPDARAAAAVSDCAFQSLSSSDVCNKYITPEAGFVVENFIRVSQSIQVNKNAIAAAGSNILSSNFINDVVDGLSEQQGDVLKSIFESIASVVLAIFPFRGVAAVANKLFSHLSTALFVTGQDSILDNPFTTVALIRENEEIQDLAERNKDLLTRQVAEIVSSAQARLEDAHNVIFGTGPGSATDQPESERDNVVFRQAASGQFLETVDDLGDLTSAMENNLKNFIVSSVMKSQGWSVLLSPRELEDATLELGTTCRTGFGGVPFVLGSQCALFRRDGEFGEQAANPSVLEGLIDVAGAITNARECAGGSPDWDAVLEGVDPGVANLPTCFYDFPVEQL